VILITGATGNCGGATLRELAARGVPVRVLTRDPSRAAHLKELGDVDLVRGDFGDVGSIDRALRGVEKVFLLPPADPLMDVLQKNLIDAAARAGVRHVVHLSATCADERQPSVSLGGHGRGERDLEASGLGWTHLRPNSFFQNTLFDAESIRIENRFYSCVGDACFAKVDTRDVGAVAAVVLTEAGHEGRIYQIDGPESFTYEQMAEKLSEVLGRRIEYVDMPGTQYVLLLKEQAGFPAWLADEMYLIYGQGPIAEGGAAPVGDVVQRLTGKPPRRYEDWVRENAAALSPA
jgi:uncharacterized protein YbjT (DUF2867 family)